jgi:hypothetical protein
MIRRGAGRGMLAALVALKFHPRRVNWIGGKAHMHVPEIASISTTRAVMEGRERGAFGPGEVVSSSSAMEDVQPGCS